VMNIERLETGTVTILRLEGDIDESGMNELRLALMRCIQEQRVNVVMNLADVGFISYLGVGVLVDNLRRLRQYQGDLKLVGMNLYSERLFRMVGVRKVFDTFDTEAQAIQRYQEAA
jgi:anti-sigma B factor antagonist